MLYISTNPYDNNMYDSCMFIDLDFTVTEAHINQWFKCIGQVLCLLTAKISARGDMLGS